MITTLNPKKKNIGPKTITIAQGAHPAAQVCQIIDLIFEYFKRFFIFLHKKKNVLCSLKKGIF
jgi:hypothetical protein